jgi:hypothetical protein
LYSIVNPFLKSDVLAISLFYNELQNLLQK